jgi:hypothetical protein
MSTDAAGMQSDAAGLVNKGMESATDAVSSVGSRTIGGLDDRLTLLGARMTIVALSFFFACFYFAQIYLQLVNENGKWLPQGVTHPSWTLGILEMGLVLGAGIVYFGAQWLGLYQRNFRRLSLGLMVATVLMVASCILHIAELHNPGFSLQGGGYVSVFIALEGTFTVFLILTTIVLFGMANRARAGLFGRSAVAVEAFGEYLGWVAAIALMNFLVLYVQPFFQTA